MKYSVYFRISQSHIKYRSLIPQGGRGRQHLYHKLLLAKFITSETLWRHIHRAGGNIYQEAPCGRHN